ncbi:MAG: hypothetical protein ACRD2L_09155 [Terriglobia bacterium]
MKTISQKFSSPHPSSPKVVVNHRDCRIAAFRKAGGLCCEIRPFDKGPHPNVTHSIRLGIEIEFLLQEIPVAKAGGAYPHHSGRSESPIIPRIVPYNEIQLAPSSKLAPCGVIPDHDRTHR